MLLATRSWQTGHQGSRGVVAQGDTAMPHSGSGLPHGGTVLPQAMPRAPSEKDLKESQNKMKSKKHTSSNQSQPQFGISFDVDGVLARGTIPLPAAKSAIHLLQNDKGEVTVPINFVTNSLNRNVDKANQISGWLGIPISPEQMIHAPGPLQLFKDFHNKHCLVIGQGRIREIVKDLGFKDICTIDEVSEAYPLLDIVDHDNRIKIATQGYTEKDFRRIEAVVLLGEPKRWEQSLQLLVDVLKTDGKPDRAPAAVPETHLPVIACNMDLQFMDRACMPRYGHGAFLLCLEALYKKCTGHDLKYTSLVGKPSEITFRFAEHILGCEARKLGYTEPLKRMYIIGDTPEVDIVGANLYQRYINRLKDRRYKNQTSIDESDKKLQSELIDPGLPQSRNIPEGATFSKQTIDNIAGILVCTGVYKEGCEPENEGDEKNYHGHRDFARIPEIYKPYKTVKDVHEAISLILQIENSL